MVKGLFRGCLIGLGVVIVFSVLGSLLGGGKKGQAASPTAATVVAPVPTDIPTERAAVPTVAATEVPVATVPPVSTEAPAAAIRPGIDPVDGQCSGEYDIKGNVGDDKIYHLPGEGTYNRTKAEVCFATIADAVAAGFRAPR